MALVCGDVHGNLARVKMFLNYKPEIEHAFTGDFLDSFRASDEQIAETFLLFAKSDAISTIGNHDINYLDRCPSELGCSGRRYNPIFKHLMSTYRDKFKGSIIRDNYIITHAGVAHTLGKRYETLEELSEYINTEIDKVVYCPVGEIVERPLSDVFWISTVRGGYKNYGGPLWSDYRREIGDNRFNQVFGHSHSEEPKMLNVSVEGSSEEHLHVCVDCNVFTCFNTFTGKLEDFMSEEFKTAKVVREMLEVGY